MKNLIPALILAVLCLGVAGTALGQGCVAVRPMSCSSSGHTNDACLLRKGEWQVLSSYRYFESFRSENGFLRVFTRRTGAWFWFARHGHEWYIREELRP